MYGGIYGALGREITNYTAIYGVCVYTVLAKPKHRRRASCWGCRKEEGRQICLNQDLVLLSVSIYY